MKSRCTRLRTVAAAWLFITACCLLAAAAGFTQKVPKISVTTDPKADFSRYKAYAWMESKFRAKQAVYHQMIIAAIEGQLAAKGLRKAEGEPDLRVVYNAGVFDLADAKGYSYYSVPYRWGATTVSNVSIAREGALTVDLVDAARNELVWRGLAHDTLSEKQGKNEQIIRKAIEKLFKKYPPSVGK
jgi:Domain of unknown function (DUF4136)